jgi:hypothetical protein
MVDHRPQSNQVLFHPEADARAEPKGYLRAQAGGANERLHLCASLKNGCEKRMLS